MNKICLLFAVAALCSFATADANDKCSTSAKDLFGTNKVDFIDMEEICTKQAEEQIRTEIQASLKYMNMGAYFAKDSVNRPGFAKFFFDAASEEREHAYKLIEYLSMRGRYLSLTKADGSPTMDINISNLVSTSPSWNPDKNLEDLTAVDATKTSGLIALQNALKLETFVTKSIRTLIVKCESDQKFNDYHFVDYLTGEFLEEQYKGQRDLAGKIATLGKMVKNNGAVLAEFLFDKQL